MQLQVTFEGCTLNFFVEKIQLWVADGTIILFYYVPINSNLLMTNVIILEHI